MKKLVSILAILAITSFAHAEELISHDKSMHLAVGTLAGGAATYYGKDENLGFFYGASLGLAKELYDASGHGEPSAKDFVATAFGAYLGAKVTGLFILPEKGGLMVNYASKFK